MNPLTQIKNTQKISREEIAAGYSDSQSWHARFKHSAYVFAGGLPYVLTDGDLLAIFSQYGEIIDVNLVRHKDSGKPRGFAFLAYEDQRSTNLAVDNLNGSRVGGRMITVDHVDNYKRKRAEAEGREESESEEEEIDEEAAEAAAYEAAAGEGAQIVSTEDATVQANGAENTPWDSKTSVYALLNADLPTSKAQPAGGEEEDPMASMIKQKKLKKEKKEKKQKSKKEKKDKKRELERAPSEEATLPSGQADRSQRAFVKREELRRHLSPEITHTNERKDSDRKHHSDRGRHGSRSPRRYERHSSRGNDSRYHSSREDGSWQDDRSRDHDRHQQRRH